MNSWHSALTRGSIPPRSSLGRLKRPTTVMTEPPPLHSPHSLTPIESIERVRSERTTTTLKSPDEQKRRRRRRRQPSCLNVKLSSSRRDSASADDGRRGDGRNERYECEIERERERESAKEERRRRRWFSSRPEPLQSLRATRASQAAGPISETKTKRLS